MKQFFGLLLALWGFATALPTAAVAFADVNLTDNGTTAVLDNGLVAVTINKATAEISSWQYNGSNILAGGYSGGKFYWSWNMPSYQNPAGCTYSLTADPATTGHDYAEVKLHMPWGGTAATAAMDVDIYYSLRRGVSGVYAAAHLSHPAAYPFKPGGEWRMAAYPGATFNWLSVDAARNKLMPTLADQAAAATVPGAPPEVMRLTTGTFANYYECKYDYSADFGAINTWGWSSTTQNIGIWMTAPSKEYYPGGPLKRELMCHTTPVLLNMLGGTHYGMGGDGDVAAGEAWDKVYGPFLIYCNQVPAGTASPQLALWQDAQTQALAEQAQWPSWFTEAAYAKAAGRGSVTGQLLVADGPTPATPAAGAWVGLAVPQVSTTGTTDFQLWTKNYQFWVKTDATGHFTIPSVLPGTYTLYAFGAGVAGQLTLPTAATVVAGGTTALGAVTWVPTRVAPTVWAIGVPDRTAAEFRHGDDYWVGGTYPSPNWAKFMNYPTEFPQDVQYTIGRSNWATDWNYVQPYNVVGTAQPAAPEWKVNFTLAAAPTLGSTSSVYVAVAAAYSAALIVKVNGTNITTPATGVFPANPADATIRMGNHGAFADLRFSFPSSLLTAGPNVISFTERKSGGDIQYDYLRLEAPGTSAVLASTTPRPGAPALALYPNPAPVQANVEVTMASAGLATCEVLSTTGAVASRTQQPVSAGPNQLRIDTGSLAPGVYTIRISQAGETRTVRFVR